MADAAEGGALTFPPLNRGQTEALSEALGPHVTLANPLDYHTDIWGDDAALAATFTAMMDGDLALGCVLLDLPRGDRCEGAAWEKVMDAVIRAKIATGRPMAIVASLKEGLPERAAARLIEAGIVPLAGLTDAVRALEVGHAVGRPGSLQEPVLCPPPETGGRHLSEERAKRALGAHGVRCPASRGADTAKEAVEAAHQVGFPAVLKGVGVAHKTDAGAVILNLTSGDAVAAAASEMACGRFLVEEMITDCVAELLIGVVADPAHGYVLTVAAGGTLTELFLDQASLMVPAPRGDVRDAVMSLRVARLLSGYRGGPAANLDAVVDTIMAIQAYVEAEMPLEVEINPLICGTKTAVAADALIRTGV